MLQVGSTPDPSTSSDYDVIARDLRQLADEAAVQDPPIRMYVSIFRKMALGSLKQLQRI